VLERMLYGEILFVNQNGDILIFSVGVGSSMGAEEAVATAMI